MKKLALLSVIASAALLFSGCSQRAGAPTDGSDVPAAQDKSGDTTKTGKITQAGQTFFLEQTGKQPVELSSYTIDLNNYVGNTVTVTGQYSGNTLFVNTIQ